MFFKRFVALVITLAMLGMNFVFAQDAGLLISPNPSASAEEQTPAPTQEELNKAATGFADIAADAPYAAAVKKLVDYGIISGYPDGTFKPEGEITRAEMTKMINLTLGFTDVEGAAGFPDVTSSNWYYAFALAAQKQGYVEGYEDKSFRGSNNITRQEMCAILNRLLKPMNLGIPVTITDTVANWARPHVELIVQNFIMPLEENNTFRATENLKRHELATVLSNMAIGPVKQIEANVRFFVNGEQYGETQKVLVGSCAVVPVDPAAPSGSQVFDGWRPIGTTEVVNVGSIVVVSDVDYEAVFAKKLHDVTFYSRGEVYYSCVAEHGGFVTAPRNPSVDGYEFLGWSLEKDGKAVKLSETKINDHTNFYAVFLKEEGSGGGGGGGGFEEPTEYTVTFFVNGDRYTSQKVEKNDCPDDPGKPSRQGYIFLGWSLEDGGSVVNLSSLKVTRKLTLYAVFEEEPEEEPEVYTVTFYVDDEEYKVQYVEEGTNPTSVPNPTKEGYIFKHWSKTKGGNEVKVTIYTVRENTDFYAVFEEKKEETFDVVFYVDGDEYETQTVVKGDKASTPLRPSKTGYKFLGWSDTENGDVVSSVAVTVTSDLKFYAVFEKIEYKVTFYVDDEEYDRQTVGEKEKAELPEKPEKDGYVFKGWAEWKGGDTVSVTSIEIIADKSFYAVFVEDEKQFEITFIADGKQHDYQVLGEGEAITLPDEPVKKDHEFLYWSKTEGGSEATVSEKAKANETYYAVFARKYIVKFYVNGSLYSTSSVLENETVISSPKVSVKDYTFMGWSDRENGIEDVDVTSYEITKDTAFYAILKKNEPEKKYFTVTFKADGKNFGTQQSVEEGGYAKEPATEPTKDKYTFEGWSDENGGEVVDITDIKITKNTVFYAVFKRIPEKFEVVFMADGEQVDVQKVLEGEFPETPKNPALDGYTFLYWSDEADGEEVNPEEIPVTERTVYYAVFEKIEAKKHKVIFWFDGEPYDFEIEDGKTATPPKTPEIEEGMVFLGWALDNPSIDREDVVEVSDIEIYKDTDFYAVYFENPNDEELLENLAKGKQQLLAIKRLQGATKEAIVTMAECIGYVLEDAKNGIHATKEYVEKHEEYGAMVSYVKGLAGPGSDVRKELISILTDEKNIDPEIQDFLCDYFGIVISLS